MHLSCMLMLETLQDLLKLLLLLLLLLLPQLLPQRLRLQRLLLQQLRLQQLRLPPRLRLQQLRLPPRLRLQQLRLLLRRVRVQKDGQRPVAQGAVGGGGGCKCRRGWGRRRKPRRPQSQAPNLHTRQP